MIWRKKVTWVRIMMFRREDLWGEYWWNLRRRTEILKNKNFWIFFFSGYFEFNLVIFKQEILQRKNVFPSTCSRLFSKVHKWILHFNVPAFYSLFSHFSLQNLLQIAVFVFHIFDPCLHSFSSLLLNKVFFCKSFFCESNVCFKIKILFES